MKDNSIQFHTRELASRRRGNSLAPILIRGESYLTEGSSIRLESPQKDTCPSPNSGLGRPKNEDISTGWCIEANGTTTVDDKESAPADLMDMLRMGKQQEMKRVFRQYSLVSFQCVCLSTWEFVLLNNSQALVDGGPALLFWSYVWSFVGISFVAASVAEMTSMCPTSGGQYHWVSEFAGRKCQRILSYVTGWMTSVAWQCHNASAVLLCGLIIQSIVRANNHSYPSPTWQTVLFTLPCIVFVAVINIFGVRVLPMLQNVGMIVNVLGVVAMLVVFWVLSPHVPTERALLHFENRGGFSTVGLAMMVGQLNAAYSMSCIDAPTHLAEEVRDASIAVPKAIMHSLLISGVMGFLIVITFAICIPDTSAALLDPSMPFAYVMSLSIPDGATTVVLELLLVLMMVASVAFAAATARSTFAFARDKGLIFSVLIAKINRRKQIPVNAVICTAVSSFLMSLIYLKSNEAFNSVVNLGQATQAASYMMSISCVLYRRLKSPDKLPNARWSLGRWKGAMVNVLAIAYALNMFMWSFVPPVLPSGPTDAANLAPHLFLGLLAAMLANYGLQARKHYVGPVMHTRDAPKWNTSQFQTGQNMEFLTGILEEE